PGWPILFQSSHERRQVDGSISVLIMVLLNLLDCGNLGITLVSNRNRMWFLWEEVQVDWLELNGPGQHSACGSQGRQGNRTSSGQSLPFEDLGSGLPSAGSHKITGYTNS
ncbi:hypothetical protein ILYODFUR_016734, partial [Ilyodon furcidens]